ncbi:MAG: hypothetical protein JNK57_08480 [Planctomycetaceae bacterium]|nr:hypothetical protein [Planctomycetaceae bacterium]
MNHPQSSFSFPSYRRLCRYLGESDAAIELTELFARSFCASAEASGNEERFISDASLKFGVRVNLSKADQFLTRLHRNYIVSVYSSAELFLHDFRREHIELFQKDWIGDTDDVDRLTVALRNVASSQKEAEGKIGADLISVFQYYRLVRNSTVHVAKSEKHDPERAFQKIVEFSTENKHEYSKLSAPNKPSEVKFDDFVLFSRITKEIAEALCSISQPAMEHWRTVFSDDLKRMESMNRKPKRVLSYVAGKLKTEWGFDDPAATRIASGVLGLN